MKVKDIMTKNIAFVSPGSTVEEAAQLMQKHNIGSVPVCDQWTLVGIVTDRDMVVRNIAHGTDPKSVKVQDIMTSQVTAATPDMDTNYVSEIMSKNQIRRMPVIENENTKKLVGMVSLGDFATNPQFNIEASEALADISKPSKPQNMS